MAKQLTFESAGEELDAILAELSDDATPLAKALRLYARAAQLISFCADALKDANVQVEEIHARMEPIFAPVSQDGPEE